MGSSFGRVSKSTSSLSPRINPPGTGTHHTRVRLTTWAKVCPRSAPRFSTKAVSNGPCRVTDTFCKPLCFSGSGGAGDAAAAFAGAGSAGTGLAAVGLGAVAVRGSATIGARCLLHHHQPNAAPTTRRKMRIYGAREGRGSGPNVGSGTLRFILVILHPPRRAIQIPSFSFAVIFD